jgi:hypothetical protein
MRFLNKRPPETNLIDTPTSIRTRDTEPQASCLAQAAYQGTVDATKENLQGYRDLAIINICYCMKNPRPLII